jgi:putative membrane-bound dehydrogenase-like protein
MKTLLRSLLLSAVLAAPFTSQAKEPPRPIRVLFLGHDSEHHNSNAYYPTISKALGRDGIYFDYVTDVDTALDPEYLNKFDALLLYANHTKITLPQLKTLIDYVESGHGFVPVHSASACFPDQQAFIKLVGGKFKSHETGVFQTKIIKPAHPAMTGVSEFEAWDETYVHSDHNDENRTVLMMRDEEPWTWVRTQGKGRVYYTASGHDQRVWDQPAFHQLLKSGILWAVGDKVHADYDAFIARRSKLTYEKRDNIPNYEKRPEPLPYQHPLSPEESLEHTQAPIDFKLELFASEPDIINPISLAWDERGRLWVAETIDYPNEVRPDRSVGGLDKIKILEDTDGDGKCDKVTVFAENLNIPTSLTFARGGIIVSQAPDFLFLKDTDGDDKADVREVLFSGWGPGDTHAGPSNLRYGFDNWIYGTVGYAGFNGNVGGKQQRFGMGVFRFKSDGSEIEFLHQFNNNTWGVGFTEEGDIFGSTANGNPSFFCGIPATNYPDDKKGLSAKMIADTTTFHPITPNIRQVDVFNGYTAGAGHAFGTSAAFPERLRNKVGFVSGPTGNLMGGFRITPDGSGYKGKNTFSIVASSDEWFSPVAAETGPDGTLWISDWYNFIIQHNPTPSSDRGGYDAVNGKGNAHVNPNRDREHGRIYRMVWDKAPASQIKTLAGADTTKLVAALGNDNLFWRLTAQRLLVDGNKIDAADALKSQVKNGGPAAIHALWTLAGLGQLDRETHQFALLSPDSALRRNAIRALGNDSAALQLFFDTATVADPDLITRRVAFNKMGEFHKDHATTIAAAARRLMADPVNAGDEWLSQALKLAGAGAVKKGPAKLGPNLFPNPSFEEITDGKANAWFSTNHSGTADFSVDISNAHTGRHSVKIASSQGGDSSWGTNIEVKPDTDYRMSGWVKTDGVRGNAMGALMNIHQLQKSALPQALKGNNDWTQITVDFNSLFGGWGQSTGMAWWDDVSLNEISYDMIDSPEDTVTEGNVAAGKTLFDTHLIAACIRCHQVGGQGGIVGPALDGIATRKDRDYIYKSLVDPGAELAETFTAEVSPMPPMGVLLKPQELEDVMAYLMTLK